MEPTGGPMLGPLVRVVRRAVDTIDPPKGKVTLPAKNPYVGDDGAQAQRSADAMTLLDAEVYGYVLVVLRKPDGWMLGETEVRAQLDPDWLPAFTATFDRIGAATR